jgi:putative ABC transport system substrate-binding protein
MKRRKFITLLGGAAAAWPFAARAQEPGRIYRLGNMHLSPRDAPHYVAFFDELRRLGFIEGQNLTVDWRGYGLRAEQFEEHAAELVKAQVDVILTGADAGVRAAQRATAAIPILARHGWARICKLARQTRWQHDGRHHSRLRA